VVVVVVVMREEFKLGRPRFREALIYFGTIGVGGEGFAFFGGERGGGDAEGDGVGNGFVFAEADGETGVEGVAGTNGVDGSYFEGGNFFLAVRLAQRTP